MGTKLVALLIFIFSVASAAETQTLIRSETISTIEYEAYLKIHPEYSAASEEFAKRKIYETSPTHLTQLFDEAEKSFLSEPVEVAHDRYKQVIQQAFKSDWSDSERKLIFHAYLRMAQTAVNAEKRNQYLIQSRQLDVKLKPDDNLFPPPLIKEWEILQAKDIFKVVQLGSSFSAYNIAFINGKRVDFKRFTLLVPKGDFRMTLFSNSRAPFTKVINAERIKSLKPSSDLLVEGSCQNPKFNRALQAPALFSGDCVTDGQKLKSESLTENYLGNLNEKTLTQNRLETRTNFDKPAFYKSGVFWTAVGAVAAYVIYKENNKDRDSDPATHKTGF